MAKKVCVRFWSLDWTVFKGSQILFEQQAYPSWRTGIYIATVTTVAALFFYYLYLYVYKIKNYNNNKIGFYAIFGFILVWAVSTSFTRLLVQHVLTTPYENGEVAF